MKKIIILFSSVILLFGCSSEDDGENLAFITADMTDIVRFAEELNYTAIAAHRGNHENVPENSLSAIRNAIDLGVEFVELDVRSTADGKLIMMHDETLDRTTNGTGFISNFTYDQIKDLKLRLDDNGSITEEKIPLLEDALELINNTIFAVIEVKDFNYATPIQMVKNLRYNDQVAFYAPSQEDVTKIKVLSENSVYISAFVESQTLMNTYSEDDNLIILNLGINVFTQDNVSKVKNKGKLAWRGLIGQVDEDMSQGKVGTLNGWLDRNPDVFNTDFPAALQLYLREKNKRP